MQGNAKKEREAAKEVDALGDAAGNAAADFGREGPEGAAAKKDGKEGDKGGADFVGITELQKRMQAMFGGAKDPVVEQQKVTNQKLDGIRAAIAEREKKVEEGKAEKRAEAETERIFKAISPNFEKDKKRLKELEADPTKKNSFEAKNLREYVDAMQAHRDLMKASIKQQILAERAAEANAMAGVAGRAGQAVAGVRESIRRVVGKIGGAAGAEAKPKTNLEMVEEFKRRVKGKEGRDLNEEPVWQVENEQEATGILESVANAENTDWFKSASKEDQQTARERAKIAKDILAANAAANAPAPAGDNPRPALGKDFKALYDRVRTVFGAGSPIAKQFDEMAKAGRWDAAGMQKLLSDLGNPGGPGSIFTQKMEAIGRADKERKPVDDRNGLDTNRILTRMERIHLRQETWARKTAEKPTPGTTGP